MRTNKRQMIFTKLALVLGGLICALLLSETFLRLYLHDDYSIPSHRNWQLRKTWDLEFARLNSLGHRDHEFTLEKPRRTFRILAIGDSFTYGDGIEQIDDLYTEVLEKTLNRRPGSLNYEVLNVAQRGWNVADYLSVLKTPGLSYRPDLVMIAFFINDIKANHSQRPKTHILPDHLHWLFVRASYLYWHTFHQYDTWKNPRIYRDYDLSYTSRTSPDWKRFTSLWIALLNTCKLNDIPVLVIILPRLTMLNDSHHLIPVYKNVEQLSKNNGVPVLNLFPVLSGYNPSTLWVGITDSHPNEQAHGIFAHQIYTFMKQQRLLPVSTKLNKRVLVRSVGLRQPSGTLEATAALVGAA